MRRNGCVWFFSLSQIDYERAGRNKALYNKNNEKI